MTRHSLSFLCAIALALTVHPLKAGTGTGSTPGGSGSPTTSGGGPGSSGVTLCLSKEAAPAGAIVQMNVIATEPKPISTGTSSLSLAGFNSVCGIAVSGDTVGIAVVNGNSIGVSLFSPTSSIGNSLEYPILTVAGRVPPDAAFGTQLPMAVDPSGLVMLDPTGAPYPTSSQPGQVLINSGVAISDVTPGSATVPAGGVVTLTGVNFVPETTIQFSGVALSSVQYVNPSRIDVTLAAAATMHGMMITATNPDQSRSTYYSYQRTQPMSPSADPLMQHVMPLMAPAEVTSATLALPSASAGTTVGVALQNIETTDAVATIVLLDPAGNAVATTQLAVDASRYVVRNLDELFGPAASAGATVKVTSSTPIEVVGVAANELSGTAAPIPAH